MAITGVMRLGEVALRVLDMDAALHHYTDVLGLRKVAADGERVYLKCWDEHDHHSVILRSSDSAGMDYCAFKCRHDADLDRLAEGAKSFGLEVGELAAGERPASGRRIRFQIPTGHWVELYAHKEQNGNGLPLRNPDPFPDGLKGIAPGRLEHCFVYGPDSAAAARFFIDVLDFRVSERLELPDGSTKACFLACNTAMHDIGIVEHNEPGKFHHLSFWLDSPEEIYKAALLLGKNDVPIDEGPTQHGIGRAKTIYFWDPSGNRNEVFSGSYLSYPDRPALTWDAEHIGKAISYPQRRMAETFMTVLT